jgi:hypothetical protein
MITATIAAVLLILPPAAILAIIFRGFLVAASTAVFTRMFRSRD